MAKCFGFSCFCCERKGRASIPDQQTVSSPTSHQTGPSQQTVPSPSPLHTVPSQQTVPSPSPLHTVPSQQMVPSPTSHQTGPSQEKPTSVSLDEVRDKLKAIDDVNKVDELIEIIGDLLQRRTAGKSAEDEAETSQSVAPIFIDTGATFLKFLDHHYEKSSSKEDFVRSAPRIVGDVLEKLGNVHWVVAGLSVIGSVLHTAETMSENYKRCLDLLQKLVDLSVHVKKLDYRLPNQEGKLKRAVVVIVKGCILCASQISSHKFSRFFKASVNAQDLSNFDKDIEYLQRDFILTIGEQKQGPVTHSQIPPTYPHEAVV